MYEKPDGMSAWCLRFIALRELLLSTSDTGLNDGEEPLPGAPEPVATNDLIGINSRRGDTVGVGGRGKKAPHNGVERESLAGVKPSSHKAHLGRARWEVS